MTTYRITSPRSRTDRAAEILWQQLERPTASGIMGVSTPDLLLIDVVRLRARKVRPATKQRIDALLTDAGYAPLRWAIDEGKLR